MLNNNKGFTFIEVVMAASIGVVLVYFGFNYFANQNKDTAKTQTLLENTLEGLTFEERIRKDMFEMKYSYNTLLLKDDNNKIFFDYLSEGNCETDCSRTITLNGKTSKEIYFLIKDNTSAVEQLYAPESAYDITGTADTNSNLSFNSLNKDNNLGLKKFTPWEIPTGITGRLILIYSPIYVYAPTAILGETPGRMIQYLGWLTPSNLTGKLNRERIATAGGNIFPEKDVRYDDEIDSEDKMLRRVPYTSGLGVFVMVAPVKVIRFRVANVNDNGKVIGKLYREELLPSLKYSESVYATNIEEVKFYRQSISNTSIDIQIKYQKK